MSLNFVAIDFETANKKRGSVIQLGIARILNGAVTKTATAFITPPPGLDYFDPSNTAIHGIRPADLVGARAWPDVLESIVRFTGDLPLVGHNVSFERSCIVQASEAHGFTAPEFDYYCTLKLSRKVLPKEPSHRLGKLSASLGLPDFSHHDAGADAIACANLLFELAARKDRYELDFLPAGWSSRRSRPLTVPATVVLPLPMVVPPTALPVVTTVMSTPATVSDTAPSVVAPFLSVPPTGLGEELWD